MTILNERLKWARKSAGYRSAKEAALRVGVGYDTYAQHENGTRGFPAARATIYARAFGVDFNWLMTGRGNPSQKLASINVIGKVAAGAEGFFEDDYAMGAGEPITSFPPEAIALTVEGDSMVPRFNPGEVLIFGPRVDNPERLIGQEVMARLDDGRKMIKVLRRGSLPNTWNLHSINSAHLTIENVHLFWVLPLLGMQTSGNR
jgi:transcriptional regulator with XRE-family HTH domain